MPHTMTHPEEFTSPPPLRTVPRSRPWQWLAAGWHDLRRAPAASITYGALFSIMGYVLLAMVYASGMFYIALSLTAGFLLVGPLLAMGLYDISRRLEQGEPPSLKQAMTVWRGVGTSTAFMGLLMVISLVVWERLTAILFALTLGSHSPELTETSADVFFSEPGLQFLTVFVLIGAALATLVFACTVVAIPLLMDHKNIDPITAILTSLAVVRANPKPMMLWGAMIVVLTGAGLLAFYIGLAITLPIIGHATWHAYRDLVEHK